MLSKRLLSLWECYTVEPVNFWAVENACVMEIGTFLLDKKYPPPGGSNSDRTAHDRSQKERQCRDYRHIRNILGILLRRDELRYHDGAQREAAASTEALECAEDNSATDVSMRMA